MKATAILKGKIQPFVSRCAKTQAGKKAVNTWYAIDDYVGEKMVKAVNSPVYEKFCQGVGECVTDILSGIRYCKHLIEKHYPKANATVKNFFSNIFPS